MTEILEAIYKSDFPKLEVEIDTFKHKTTEEIRFCVMRVNTNLCGKTHMYIYDASEWEKLDTKLLQGTERIQESFYSDILEQIKNKEM